MYCEACGNVIVGPSCTHCGTAITVAAPVPVRSTGTGVAGAQPAIYPPNQPPAIIAIAPKNPGVAAVLSFFFVGLGQIYNGQIGKGIVLIVAYIFSILLIFVFIGIITTPLLWIFGMIDAYQTADRLNRFGQ